MPRVTTQQYLDHQNWVRAVWLEDQSRFSYLTTRAQRHLHDYFCPDRDMPADEAHAYRAMVSPNGPSLPQQAGRALVALHQAVELGVRQPGSRVSVASSGGRVIHVSAVARATVDTAAIVRALLLLLRQPPN